jgi:hypothetical protein
MREQTLNREARIVTGRNHMRAHIMMLPTAATATGGALQLLG